MPSTRTRSTDDSVLAFCAIQWPPSPKATPRIACCWEAQYSRWCWWWLRSYFWSWCLCCFLRFWHCCWFPGWGLRWWGCRRNGNRWDEEYSKCWMGFMIMKYWWGFSVVVLKLIRPLIVMVVIVVIKISISVFKKALCLTSGFFGFVWTNKDFSQVYCRCYNLGICAFFAFVMWLFFIFFFILFISTLGRGGGRLGFVWKMLERVGFGWRFSY